MPTPESASPEGTEKRSAEVTGGEATPMADPEVVARPLRRRFTAEYKLRILEELDRAGPGGMGAIVRREGLYSSHITAWRQARRRGALGTLSRKRGRKRKQVDPAAKKLAEVQRENMRLREELRKAQLIIDVQGKVAGLLGLNLETGRDS